MAENKIGFFNRLFSSKRNHNIEKNSKEIFVRNEGESEHREIKCENEILENKESGKIDSVINEKSENSDSKIGNESVLYRETNLNANVYSSDNVDSGFGQNYENIENKDSSVRTAATVDSYSSSVKEAGFVEDSSLNREHNSLEDQSKLVSDDYALENESFTFLSKLEQFTIKLGDEKNQKSMPLVIEYLLGIANEAVEFAGHLYGSDQRKLSLKALFSRDAKSYKMLGLKFVENDRLVINVAVIENNDNPRQAFVDLSNDLLHLINIYLGVCVKVFSSDQMSEQWKTIYKGFLKTLTESVRSSQVSQQN